ncbi:ABC transporter substrate-binding protein [Mycolicibacterium tokaiense]|jgi:putative spermidine/putrescine transport system substrate-binding protein|uniref:Spermidine/putrescine-binding periplasmic protein n=1 Tax=Mycolicibacterium tokaiense TaxID=39695 RepID=A0A378TNT6_9MYCO|nr:ABC transporter substrate-binding protein [Mycolicibacterium tokaiense]BBY89380.1 ABC transporter [Mycolicibacterium tokaiense]STZ62234.1 Spermidine/putrescine-binding periplasmic protein precursor [Mycolicibacterium tokaiense]
MTTTPIRRVPLALTAAAVITAVTAACSASSQAPSTELDLGSGPPQAGTVKAGALDGVTLTFVSYGGIFQDGQTKAAIEPFAQESGATVLQDGPTENSKIKAQVDSGNVTWDVVDTTNVFSAKNCGELFMPIDTSIVDTSKIPEGAQTDECSVPAMGYGLIVVYNTEKYGANPPKTWADFYDTAKFPGKRGMQGISGELDPGVFEGALLADGVAADAIYPIDAERALGKMSSIRDDFVFWTTGAQAQQLLEAGQVDMALLWSGRAYSAVKNGAPFAPMWDQWMPEADTIAVPKGAKNPKASMALINYYLGAEQQAKLSELTSYSPINVDAKPQLDELAQAYLTTSPERLADRFPIDLPWWAENQDAMITAYTDWLAG